ncbi:nucleotide disphospho-sugar-binding domain-containing protein [Granulicella sp. dw_53]|uniref:glycosyltransferase n=1 Tax=Granulicella sp. dw_53 TaxID=2719792 RepID=UPI0031F62930
MSTSSTVQEFRQQIGSLHGLEALALVWKILAWTHKGLADDLFRVLREERIDAVVLDEGQAGLALVPMYLGMPYATISNSFHLDFTGGTPLCIFDWPHDSSPQSLARNREGLRKTNHIFEPSRIAARSYAEGIGLDQRIDWNDPFALISKLAWITQSLKEFDFAGTEWPSQFHHTGPFHDGAGRIDVDFPWDRLTGEPLIYASMGTGHNGIQEIFNTIAKAAGTQPGTQLVLSIGQTVDPKMIQSLPPNSIVVRSAPQQELLARSSLCITHAGLNTTLESLMHGVPMVAIPVTNDQPGNAAKIAHTKTGAFVPIEELSVPRLSSLIDQVMGNPKYRQNAMRMKETIAETNGLERAVDLLEEAFHLSSQRTPVPSHGSEHQAPSTRASNG